MKPRNLIDEKFGLPGNAGREFGEKFIRDLIGSGKFAELWTAFEATYPELQPELQAAFEKTNNLLRYIKPEQGDETYKISSMPEAAAQELDNLLNDILETLEFISSQNEEPGIEMVKAVVEDFNNTFSDMLAIFTSNTDSDKPLEPYKQTNIGFEEQIREIKTMKKSDFILETDTAKSDQESNHAPHWSSTIGPQKLENEEYRKKIKSYIQELFEEETLNGELAEVEEDVEDELEDLIGDIKSDLDIDAPETEQIGLTLAGVALSLPEIVKLIGKFVNLISKIPGLKKLSGDKLIEIGEKYHHKIVGAFEFVLKKAGVKDSTKAHKFAEILHMVIVASLLTAGVGAMATKVSSGNLAGAAFKGAINAVKTNEIGSFLMGIIAKL